MLKPSSLVAPSVHVTTSFVWALSGIVLPSAYLGALTVIAVGAVGTAMPLLGATAAYVPPMRISSNLAVPVPPGLFSVILLVPLGSIVSANTPFQLPLQATCWSG